MQLRIIYRDLFGKLKTDFAKQSNTILLYSFSAALLKMTIHSGDCRQFNKGRVGTQKLLFSIEFMVCETEMGSRI